MKKIVPLEGAYDDPPLRSPSRGAARSRPASIVSQADAGVVWMPPSVPSTEPPAWHSEAPLPEADDSRDGPPLPPPPPTDGLPAIRLVAGEIPRILDEAEAAILGSGRPILLRAGEIVRPTVETVPAAHGRSTLIAKLSRIEVPGLIELMASVAVWQRWDARRKEWKATDPEGRIASILLARGASLTMPRVTGVISTPTLRADGSILSTPGYDLATRLYLVGDASVTLPDIPERPTRAQAQAALGRLLDLLTDFPFVGPVDRAVALSGLMTPVLRGAMPVAPLHAIRAHAPGSGKSYLVDLSSTIANGRPCPVIAAGKTEEETEKRLGALLREGVSIVSLDNVNGELGGDALCQMVERPLVRIRILGQSDAPEYECRATTFATGNNLVLVGDMVRRVVLCTLDPEMERPETRSFDGSPIDRVLSDRGGYVAAILTIARAYIAAGMPGAPPPIGSYGAWSDLVRAPLMWLGEADPIASMDTAREEDPELSAIRELFGQWREHLSLHQGYTSRALADRACERAFQSTEFIRPDFRDLLLRVAGDGGVVSTKRLGKWLARIGGRVVAGHKIWAKADASNGSRFSLITAGRDA